jgi:hypothetical protein
MKNTKNTVYQQNPDVMGHLTALLEPYKKQGYSRPGQHQNPMHIANNILPIVNVFLVFLCTCGFAYGSSDTIADYYEKKNTWAETVLAVQEKYSKDYQGWGLRLARGILNRAVIYRKTKESLVSNVLIPKIRPILAMKSGRFVMSLLMIRSTSI